MTEGFYGHLRDAIRINGERRRVYRQLSGGRSEPLSRQLIRAERMCLAPALWFDWRARPFNRRGIAVVRGDFVGMDDLPAPDTEPTFTGKASAGLLVPVRRLLHDLRRNAERLTPNSDSSAAFCRAAHETLSRLCELEMRAQAHFAMTHHLVQSIGYAASNACGYATASDERSWPLSRRLIRFQCRGLQAGIGLDIRAQSLHRRNVGFLVNDLPTIPFPKDTGENNG